MSSQKHKCRADRDNHQPTRAVRRISDLASRFDRSFPKFSSFSTPEVSAQQHDPLFLHWKRKVTVLIVCMLCPHLPRKYINRDIITQKSDKWRSDNTKNANVSARPFCQSVFKTSARVMWFGWKVLYVAPNP